MALERWRLLPALMLVAACGSKAPGSGTPPPGGGNPPGGGGEPTAAFGAPASVTAGEPVAFDASASKAADGSALSYFWDFGGGRRGAGRSIARVFDEVGARPVALTVVDGQGRSARTEKTLEVTPGPSPSGTVNAVGRVHDLDGHPLQGVAVTLGGGTPASTDSLGQVQIQVPAGAPATLGLSKAGFSDQVIRLELPASSGADADFEATLRARDPAQTLADASAGGTLQGRDGARIVLPPGALVDSTGAAVSGSVDVTLTPVDVTAPYAGGFPGKFAGLGPDATLASIVSLGTTEFVPSRSGERLQLAMGKTVEVDLPLYAGSLLDGSSVAAGQVLPLWSLDESTGLWIQEGTGTVVASASSPTGLAMHATVSHLSWWNCDRQFDPFTPRPRCVYDTDIGLPGGEDQFATATICDLLADIDRGGRTPVRAPLRRSSAASVPESNLPGFAATTTIPIAGEVALPVPPGVPIHFAATVLNGTWTGETVVSGAVGEAPEVLIKMRPLAGAGPGQLVTPPTDLTATLQPGDVVRYDFDATVGHWATVTVGPAQGSTLEGRVRLLLGVTELASADFASDPVQLVQEIPSDGRYTVEIRPTANAPGAFHFQLELGGTLQATSRTLPFDTVVDAPPFTVSRQDFSLVDGHTVLLGLQSQNLKPLTWRLRVEGDTDGPPVARGVAPGQELHAIHVPGPGRYWLDLDNAAGSALLERVTAERTAWEPLVTGPVAADDLELVDLIADHAGAPVIIRRALQQVAGAWTEIVSLLRWNGTTLSPVGPDISHPLPCGGTGFLPIDATFDANNVPYVLYPDAVGTPSGPARFNLRRLAAGAWEAVGPDQGALPKQGTTQQGCYYRPAIRILPDGTPMVAYLVDQVLWVQKLQADAWVGAVSPTGDSYPAPVGQYDLQIDPAGRPVLVRTARDAAGTATVTRLSSTPSWDPVGPNGGALTLPATLYSVGSPHLRFDSAGNPVLGLSADINEGGGTGSWGVAVARFDGSAWTLSDGHHATADSGTGAQWDMGFAVLGADAVMAWDAVLRPIYRATVAQRYTSAGWSGLGSVDGVIPQLADDRPLVEDVAFSQRLLVTGGTLYLAVVRTARSGKTIDLLRYVP